MSIGKMAPDLKQQFHDIAREFQENDGDQDSQQLVLAISPTISQADTFEQETGAANNLEGEEIIDLEKDGQDVQAEEAQYARDAQAIIDQEWEEMTPERIDENGKNKIPCIKRAISTPKKQRKVAKRCIVYGKEKENGNEKKKMSQDCKCRQSEVISTNLTNFNGKVEMEYCLNQFTLTFQSGVVNNDMK